MQIELSREQYRQLLILIFLGEWVANGSQLDEQAKQALQATADHIYALAQQYGADDWVEYCEECGVYHANETMEEALFPLIDEYDEETFWDVLSHHLAYRDVVTAAGQDKEFTKEMEMRLWRRKEQYEQEFQKHGLEHVRLVFHGGKRGR
ncbi:MAG: hypothetical protein K6T31_06280 [Alicyclobacillus sp.]|nr:hypothetical protein [Alicyclobacillus sp.]